VKLVDTHAHLGDRKFHGLLEQVIQRAVAADIAWIVTVGTDLASSREALSLAERYRSIYAAVGIHPHEADQASGAHLAELVRLSRHKKVVAIGEMGLDFYRNLSPHDKQREAFVAQLELARQADKPVIIHDRDAHGEAMSILRDHGRNLRGVLHCFSGDREMAAQAIHMGFYISFAGPVTFENAHRLHELARELPLEWILTETDCPYLAPHPHRGQRNEPAYVRLVAARIAALRGLPLDRVAEATTQNALHLFGPSIDLSSAEASPTSGV
jgi:TatD DNase family protein